MPSIALGRCSPEIGGNEGKFFPLLNSHTLNTCILSHVYSKQLLDFIWFFFYVLCWGFFLTLPFPLMHDI